MNKEQMKKIIKSKALGDLMFTICCKFFMETNVLIVYNIINNSNLSKDGVK